MTISFERTEWAPGVWAGTEGATVSFGYSRYIIKSIDFENRILTLDPLEEL